MDRRSTEQGFEVIDWRIVHALCRERLADFRSFARQVMAFVDGRATRRDA